MHSSVERRIYLLPRIRLRCKSANLIDVKRRYIATVDKRHQKSIKPSAAPVALVILINRRMFIVSI